MNKETFITSLNILAYALFIIGFIMVIALFRKFTGSGFFSDSKLDGTEFFIILAVAFYHAAFGFMCLAISRALQGQDEVIPQHQSWQSRGNTMLPAGNILEPSSSNNVSAEAAPYVNYLSGLGYDVQRAGQRWSIKKPNSTACTHIYSIEDLRRQVESVSKENNIPFNVK